MTLPFQLGPPDPHVSAHEFGAVNVGTPAMGQVPVTQAQIGLPLELGPPGAQMLASGFGAVYMEMATMGQVPATQAQLSANPASEDVFSSLALPLQFSWIPVAPGFGSVNVGMATMGQVPVTPAQMSADTLPLHPDVAKLWSSEPGDGCHGVGSCDADPDGHQLCQCTCGYLYQYCLHADVPQARW